MTDKEFKRLSRAQLIDIIYELQLKQEELAAENERLSKALADIPSANIPIMVYATFPIFMHFFAFSKSSAFAGSNNI